MGIAIRCGILTMGGIQLAKCLAMHIFIELAVTTESEKYGIQEKTGTWKVD